MPVQDGNDDVGLGLYPGRPQRLLHQGDLAEMIPLLLAVLESNRFVDVVGVGARPWNQYPQLPAADEEHLRAHLSPAGHVVTRQVHAVLQDADHRKHVVATAVVEERGVQEDLVKEVDADGVLQGAAEVVAVEELREGLGVVAHLLEVVQAYDSPLQLRRDVEIFQGAPHERHVLLVSDLERKLQRLLPNDGGDDDSHDDHADGAEHRNDDE
mmetsp:Transcript_20375/g.46352  ORF Transcript_20375/g.46352 Transcript_20375/m.46352 type:complete len:212 (+) Transcript_20375:489-1124(+)